MEKVQRYMNIGRKYRLLLAALFAMTLCSCDELFPSEDDGSGFFEEETKADNDIIVITDTEFSPDYKTICLTAEIVRDLGPFSLADTNSVRIQAREFVGGVELAKKSSSQLTSVVNVEGDIIVKTKLKLLLLVDLTLPQEIIDVERANVIMAASTFIHDNLYVSFFYGDQLTETLPVTDYILDNYFVHHDDDHKLLYRSIVAKQNEMQRRQGVWADAKAMLLVVMSDGKAFYDNNQPMDPEHFQLQEKMIRPDVPPGGDLVIDYVNVAPESNRDDDEDFLSTFCHLYQGEFLNGFNWVTIRRCVHRLTGVDIVDNKFYLTNPDYKVYRGGSHRLTLEVYNAANDSLVATGSTKIKIGSIYDPIIINGHSLTYVISQGLAIGIFLFLIVYLVYQLLIPYIRYRRFLKKYVVSYSNSNQSVDGVMVGQSCYLCKAPYVEGDEVVVKCEHTMHLSCWDENEYHCPEYSDYCKSGSHYYNHYNRFDPRNASFYMRWVLAGIAAAVLAWVCFTISVHHVVGAFQSWVSANIFGIDATSSEVMKTFEDSGINMYLLPSFGLTTGFFLTLAMAILTTWHRRVRFKWLWLFVRALLASIASFLAFQITAQVLAMIGMADYSTFFEWIPWTFTGFIIAYMATYGTPVSTHKLLIFLSVVLAILSMFLWSALFNRTFYDFRVMLLLSYITFSVGLALCIASRAPRSNHYYLQVSGAVKKMDVALYKWFRGNAGGVVTIGRSIDCTLQLSWDTTGVVAPVQAELRCHGDSVRLYALEDGVYLKDSKPLEVGKYYQLYHGDSFEIGRTTFTYIEKDL